MLFRFFLSRFSAALSAFLVLVRVFLPSKAHAQVRGATLSSGVGRFGGGDTEGHISTKKRAFVLDASKLSESIQTCLMRGSYPNPNTGSVLRARICNLKIGRRT
jgi:hypothetical protein